MDPLICLALGAIVGSLASGFLVWLTTSLTKRESPDADYAKLLRNLVGRGILPSHVWEQLSRELRPKSQISNKPTITGYQTDEELNKFQPKPVGIWIIFGLWIVAGIFSLLGANENNWLLTTASILLSSVVWGISRNKSLLHNSFFRMAWTGCGIAAWVLGPLGHLGADADPQKLIFGGFWGLVCGMATMSSLEACIRGTRPGNLSIFIQGCLLFAPTFLLPMDWSRWHADSRDWSPILLGPWSLMAGAAWGIGLAARQGFSSTGFTLGASFATTWLVGWTSLYLSGNGEGKGLPAFAIGAFIASCISVAIFRLSGFQEAKKLTRFPTGVGSFWVTLFLAGCGTAMALPSVGHSTALAGGVFIFGSICAWICLNFSKSNFWGLASLGALLIGIFQLSVYIHNSVPVPAWWPFLAKALGLGFSFATLCWCLAVGQFPSKKIQPFVCFASLAGCVAWLLPTQALVIATLVEPTWMSEVIRGPLGVWWNWPLAVFSVGIGWWMHRSLHGMRQEIWTTIFVLISAGLATAEATLGLDTEESPQGVLAVLAAWTAGSCLISLYRSRWASVFANLFLGFAWFLAWSQSNRLPESSPYWSLVPALLAWFIGTGKSLTHGKRWIPLASSGSLMVALSTWSSLTGANFGPGLLIGAVLMAINLAVLEIRHGRIWLAPQKLNKTIRLREPALWLGVTQLLILVGSFLSIAESGHGGWLTVGFLAQAIILWLVRGNSSKTLAHLQTIGSGIGGGLALLATAETLDNQGLVFDYLGTIPSLGFFIPGALLGLAIRQLVFGLRTEPQHNDTRIALVIFGIPIISNASFALNPNRTVCELLLATFSCAIWPILAWFGASHCGKDQRHKSRKWHELSLCLAPLPVSMGLISLLGLGTLDLTTVFATLLAGTTLTAGWCLIAPQMDIDWTLQARQAFAPSGRRLLVIGLAFQIVLFGLAQTNSGSIQPDWKNSIALLGFTGNALIAGLMAQVHGPSRKAIRLQYLTLSSLAICAAWSASSFSDSSSFSRSLMVFLGIAFFCAGTRKWKGLADWSGTLQIVGLAIPMAVMLLAAFSMGWSGEGKGLFSHWGIDTFAHDWTPWAAELCILGIAYGLMGSSGASNHWHNSIRLAFLAWFFCGWAGICLIMQGPSAQGMLLAFSGILIGARVMLNRTAPPFAIGQDPINREAA